MEWYVHKARATWSTLGKWLPAFRQSLFIYSGGIDWCPKYNKKTTMTRVHMHYGQIVADVTGALAQRAWREEDRGSLARTVKESKRMLAQIFDKHCDLGMNTVKYHLHEHVMENIRRFGALYALRCSPFGHWSEHIKQKMASS